MGAHGNLIYIIQRWAASKVISAPLQDVPLENTYCWLRADSDDKNVKAQGHLLCIP